MHRVLIFVALMALVATSAHAQVPWLFYASNAGGSVQIWRSHLDGSNAEQLTNFAEQATNPFVFMGGTKVGFRTAGSWPDVAGALWVMDPDGANLEQWTAPGVIDYRPYYHKGREELWLSRSDCGESFKILDLQTLALRDFLGGPISWSANIVGGPAEDDVYFVACSCNNASTCGINRATLIGDNLTSVTPVTNNGAFESGVQVSALGQVAYVKAEGSGGIGAPANIYVNGPSGGQEAPVTFHAAPDEAHSLSWSFEESVIYYVLKDGTTGINQIRCVDLATGSDVLFHGDDGFDYQIPTAAVVHVPCNAGGVVMTAAEDVPDDQGGQLRLTFSGSEFDAPASPTPILQYEIFRKVAGMPARRREQESPLASQVSAPRIAGWDYVGAIPAHGETQYHAIAPTLVDENNVSTTYWDSEFFVRAATVDPLVFYDSCPIVAMSVDNLAPAAPASMVVDYLSGSTLINWSAVAAEDLHHYEVYRYPRGSGIEDPSTQVSVVVGTRSTDDSLDPWEYEFTVAAVDHNGNIGPKVEPVMVTLTGMIPQRISRLMVPQNKPNPFNPSTSITYFAPSNGRISIRIFDLRGQLVRELFEGEARPGENSQTWDGMDDGGSRVASGIYLYEVRGFGETVLQKMALVK